VLDRRPASPERTAHSAWNRPPGRRCGRGHRRAGVLRGGRRRELYRL